ncbi:olfactory receptor class A-like protein 1 [Ornithorhynchus anatinus]|uniref:olfactory receptor class A-like protein 1 n=1 Tax=Ornithorhynchus anatinus TaxID=9258 RepID=UPI0010A76671|nr:olfactory receptor class A-like protein 1 [Ornithorhynchus anatinus]
MKATELSFGIVFLLQIGIGISVNLFLFLFYSRTVTASRKVSPSDLILIHLAFSNAVILLSFGLPETLSAWGLRNFLSDGGCKILMYVFRVARGLSICSTCLLSVFQAVTISPGTTRWARIKVRLPGCVLPSCLLSWGLSLLVDFDALFNITGPRNSSTVQIVWDLKYCSKVSNSAEISLLITVVLSFRDLFFVVLMSLASGYMVFVLHRHHRRVRHLHGSGRSPGATSEVRAAKRVVALVTLYVLLYGRQSIMLSVLLNRKEKSPLLVSSHVVLSFTFSAMSPFLMIHSDRRIKTFWKKGSALSHVDSS